jgi:hypothetical protein
MRLRALYPSWRCYRDCSPALSRGGVRPARPPDGRRRSSSCGNYIHLSSRFLLGAGRLCSTRQVQASSLCAPLSKLDPDDCE